MSKVRARTVTWGVLVLTLGGMLVALALGVQFTLVTVAVILLVVTGVMLAIFALRPTEDDARAALANAARLEHSEESELFHWGVGQQQPLDAGGAEVDPGDR